MHWHLPISAIREILGAHQLKWTSVENVVHTQKRWYLFLAVKIHAVKNMAVTPLIDLSENHRPPLHAAWTNSNSRRINVTSDY
jgi:hypothetical protein